MIYGTGFTYRFKKTSQRKTRTTYNSNNPTTRTQRFQYRYGGAGVCHFKYFILYWTTVLNFSFYIYFTVVCVVCVFYNL